MSDQEKNKQIFEVITTMVLIVFIVFIFIKFMYF
jgi:hypothetical protein